MNKILKYALMLAMGIAICMPTEQNALAQTEQQIKKEVKSSGKSMWRQSKKMARKGSGNEPMRIAEPIAKGDWAVVDFTSGPAHAIVLAAEEFLGSETDEERKIKEKIRPRISVVYEKDKKKTGLDGVSEALGDDDDMGDDFGVDDVSDDSRVDEEVVDEVLNKKKKKIDAKLSKIKIKSNEVTDAAAEGIAGEGVDGLIEQQGNTGMGKLVDNQLEKYISAAGTQETIAAYEKQRRYDEQEQAVQMIAYAATVRQNVNEIIGGMIEKARANYDESDVKKDLDPKNKKDKVEKTNDYNQALRQYAYYSLIYDQLLSLEQQVLGMRLQAKGALAEQKSNVLSDVLENK